MPRGIPDHLKGRTFPVREDGLIDLTAAAVEVMTNSDTLTRWTGTPTLRAALASPPTAKIQLPNRARASSHVATAVMPIHHRTLIRKL